VENKITIYSLIDPISNEVRYIGKTIQKPESRHSSHISQSKHNKKKDYTHCWIKSLLNNNNKPILNIVEETYDITRETYWIKYYRELGCKLTNFTDGGELGNIGKTWKVKDSSKMGRKRIHKEPKIHKLNKPVIAFKENKKFEFLTPKIASTELNIEYSGIMKCLRGDISKIKGYKFIYNELS